MNLFVRSPFWYERFPNRVRSKLVGNNPREILTKAVTSDGKPLFSNAQDLARSIAEIPPHPNEATAVALLGDPDRSSNRYYNRPKQAGVFLNIVLSGVRPCPDSLRALIAESIRRRLGKDRSNEAEVWISKLEASFTEREASEREERSSDANERLALRLLDEATDLLIARPTPHDEFELLSDPVIKSIIKRQGLVGDPEFDSSSDLPQITICLPSDALARHEAQLLIKWIRSRTEKLNQHDRDVAEARLCQVVENGIFNVVAVQNAPTVIPFIIFGLNDPDDARGFCFTVNRHGRAGFLQLPSVSCFKLQVAFLGEFESKSQNHLSDVI